jgi:hypothetical protein
VFEVQSLQVNNFHVCHFVSHIMDFICCETLLEADLLLKKLGMTDDSGCMVQTCTPKKFYKC